VSAMVLIDSGYHAGDVATALGREPRHIADVGYEAFARKHFSTICIPGTDPALRDWIIERALAMEPALASNLFFSAVEFDAERSADTLRLIKRTYWCFNPVGSTHRACGWPCMPATRRHSRNW
jgi:hypothetical protein